MTQLLAAVALSAAMVFTAACDSPTLDAPFSLAGNWSGVMPIRTPDGSWTEPARVTLTQTGDSVTGELVSSDGARYELAGTATEEGATITLQGLPGTSTCAGVIITADRFWITRDGTVTRMSGRTSGRCFGTIAGSFTLARES